MSETELLFADVIPVETRKSQRRTRNRIIQINRFVFNLFHQSFVRILNRFTCNDVSLINISPISISIFASSLNISQQITLILDRLFNDSVLETRINMILKYECV